jgi:ElaB/YqjD/DUF883 family membrane-anchored ribosome-binding protein
MNEQQHIESSQHYEREAEATRYRLAQRLDELSDRLTPGQVFDEMLTYARGGGGSFLRALSNAARENPIPTFLIGAGCMMFLSDKIGLNRYVSRDGRDGAPGKAMSRASSQIGDAASRAASGLGSVTGEVRSHAQSATEFAGEQASNLAGTVRGRASAVGDAISEASQRMREKADHLRDQAAGAVEQMSGGAQNLAESVQEQVSQSVEQARRQTAETARRVKEQVTSFVNEQPFFCAALGLAAGAALAAVLPATKMEHEIVGPTSDAVKGAVGDAASESVEVAKNAAGRIAQNAIGTAGGEGLTPAAVADAARNIGDKVKRAVSETGASVLREPTGRDQAT